VNSQLLLAVLGTVVLLGAALFTMLRVESRRETRTQRLKGLVAAPTSVAEPAVSLRRPIGQRARGLFLLPAGLWARLDGAFAATGNSIGMPHLLLCGSVAAAAAVVFAGRVMDFGPALVLVFGVVAGVATPALMLRFFQGRYRQRFLDVFPDALELIGRAVRAGLPVVEAMEVVAREIRPPVGIEYRRTLDEARLGVEIETALQHTADRIRVPDFRFYVVTLALQRRTGGSLGETLATLSNIIRRRKEVRLKSRALSAESKASAFVLAILPFVVTGILFLLNGELMSPLLHDPRGRFMLGLAFLSLATGIGVMVLMIRRALRY
jgi:tight adherence protein B